MNETNSNTKLDEKKGKSLIQTNLTKRVATAAIFSIFQSFCLC